MAAFFILFVVWIVTAILCGFVAEDKKHSALAWGFAGLLFGPIALIATIGLADRHQHQLLRKIADALSSEPSAFSLEAIEPGGTIEGADDYNTCLKIFQEKVGPNSMTAKRAVYAKSVIKADFLWLMDEDEIQLAQFMKNSAGEWKINFLA